MAKSRQATPEQEVKTQICQYLEKIPGMVFWLNHTVGQWDAKRRVFRKRNSRYDRNGVSDILGCYRGRFLAIEVKASTSRRVSDNQSKFIKDIKAAGGIAFVARSVSDVIANLFDNPPA